MIAEILHLDNTRDLGSSLQTQVQQLIQNLPKRLRKQPVSLRWKKTPGGLCDLHRPLNADLIHDLLRLVQHEVTTHFRQLDAYPNLIQPAEALVLAHLRSLKGLWTKPSADSSLAPSAHSSVAPGAWAYQINGCAACILARIASDKEIICNLRVVLQSRTRTRKKHRPRRLSLFIDECINQFTPDEAEVLHSTASQLAYRMKNVRKACVKTWMSDPNQKHTGHSQRRHRRHRGKQQDISAQTHRIEKHQMPSITLTDLSEDDLATSSKSTHPNSNLLDDSAFHREGSSLSRTGQLWNEHDPERRRRSRNPSPESHRSSHWSNLNGPARLERPSLVPGRVLQQSRYDGHSLAISEHRRGDLAEKSETMTMYQKLAEDNPYSRATPVPEAMVDPLGIHSTGQAFDGDGVQQQDEMEVPFIYQYSPSDYSSSDWTDDECEDWDGKPSTTTGPSPAGTTWSLLCEHHNFI
ncbi:uncharacterized protein N7482_006304 [Penicillium canariense]|uniref:Uncharacterized protein n=1 Tax=Penicillium canariense TaxID=189055 RepID=A0A9W9I648_9EURO|nr:uncharacterized protein N7482_006304 [Penicillium canariense]KAJ5167523.1 hypothetical protein N7482_006304 [Penicillium canariense]